MKISIVGGAGTLGATTAFRLCQINQITEICLIDVNENLAKNHMMDLHNAYPGKKVHVSSHEGMKDSQIVIITAGIPNRNDVQSRNVFLQGNLVLFDEIGAQIKLHAPDALILTASNPVDALNYYLYKTFHFEKSQLLGYTLNDSFRFERAVRSLNKFPSEAIFSSPVVGEHGSTQVPLFSRVAVSGEKVYFSSEDKERVKKSIQSWFLEFNQLNINRTTGWTTAAGIGQIIEALIMNEKDFLTLGSVILTGEYGIKDISLGAPIRVRGNRIVCVEEWEITAEELTSYRDSAEVVKCLIEPFLNREVGKL